MIHLKNIERSYKTGAGQTWVLRRIDLTIQEGEFVTIMGPSGAGKSSLLNVLALLDDQWTGQAQDRHGLPELSPARRPHRAGEHRSSPVVQGHPTQPAARHGR